MWWQIGVKALTKKKIDFLMGILFHVYYYIKKKREKDKTNVIKIELCSTITRIIYKEILLLKDRQSVK